MLTGSNGVRPGSLGPERRPLLHVLSKILLRIKWTALCKEAL